jgi:hypothetical protein
MGVKKVTSDMCTSVIHILPIGSCCSARCTYERCTKLRLSMRWTTTSPPLCCVPTSHSYPTTVEICVRTVYAQLRRRRRKLASLYFTLLYSTCVTFISCVVLRQALRRAAGALVELGLHKKAIKYYEVAIRLDTSLEELLRPTIARLRVPGETS